MPGLSDQDRDLLRRFEARVREALPGRVARVVAFGSRARGDHDPDSDLDVAVFVRDYRYADRAAVVQVAAEFLGREHTHVQALAFGANRYDEVSFLMRNIRTEGLSA
jgi:predicted nucleotidyltransferase